MTTATRRRRALCASCDGVITEMPVFRMDEPYCCLGCADGGPCICTYEQDLADDGVDHLGLPFAMDAIEEFPDVTPTRTSEPDRREVIAR